MDGELKPADVVGLVQRIVDLYGQAELELLRQIARRLNRGITGTGWQEIQLVELQAFQRQALALLEKLTADSAKVVQTQIGMAGNRGAAVAVGSQITPAATVAAPVFAVTATAAELEQTLGATRGRIYRSVDDIYRRVIIETVPQVTLGTITRRQAAERSLAKLASNGVTGFVDRAGKKWEMTSYVESASRASAMNAAIEGHTARLQASGHNLVIVSDVPQECEKCRPFEGKVLAIEPDGEHQTLDQARAAGLYHPNAILGDHAFQSVGIIENAVRAWYDGPSVELTTARGVRLTVSPNHPVLTSRGWVRAEGLRKGDQVFRPRYVGRGLDRPEVGDELDQVKPRVANVFDTLQTSGSNMRVPAAGHDLHGDGKFCQGEIEVVVTNGRLLHIPNVELVEQICDHRFSWTGVQLKARTSVRPSNLGQFGVGSSIRGALADVYASGFEPSAQGRIADSEHWREVLAGLPAGVETDELVGVDRATFQGWAYDFQTSFGAYVVNSILVHNCRHSHARYQPGVTRSFGETADPDGDKARQKLRYLERCVRAAKREEAAAMSDEGRAKARAKVRAYQAKIRAHVATTSAKRQPHRERLTAAR